jgi:hypothetical protein
MSLASAPEGEEKGGGQREVAGCSEAPKSAISGVGTVAFRRAIFTAWRRIRLGFQRGIGEGSGCIGGEAEGTTERARGKRGEWGFMRG